MRFAVPLTVLTPRDRQQLQEFLERATRVLGLRLCYHDLLNRTGLPLSWLQHENPACLAVKREHQPECARFCGQRIERESAALPEGSIHVCPFGHTDITAAVRFQGMLAGVLYAGVAWTGKGKPPRLGFVVRPSRQWLDDRRSMLLALARQMETLLAGEEESAEPSRQEAIVSFLNERLAKPLRLPDLARFLNLSPSRAGHIVKDIFSETFPRLVTRLRLTRAARLLSSTELSTGAIALDTGFADQSHFTRAFRAHYGMSPTVFRRTHRVTV